MIYSTCNRSVNIDLVRIYCIITRWMYTKDCMSLNCDGDLLVQGIPGHVVSASGGGGGGGGGGLPSGMSSDDLGNDVSTVKIIFIVS